MPRRGYSEGVPCHSTQLAVTAGPRPGCCGSGLQGPFSRSPPSELMSPVRGVSFSPRCITGTVPAWLGAAWGVVGDSSQPAVPGPCLGKGHTLLTAPLSPQTLKIVRTAELSPFIVFIAPTDKAEEVSGRVSPPVPPGWASWPTAEPSSNPGLSPSVYSCLLCFRWSGTQPRPEKQALPIPAAVDSATLIPAA